MNLTQQILSTPELNSASHTFWDSQCLMIAAAREECFLKCQWDKERKFERMHHLACKRRDEARKTLNGFSTYL